MRRESGILGVKDGRLFGRAKPGRDPREQVEVLHALGVGAVPGSAVRPGLLTKKQNK